MTRLKRNLSLTDFYTAFQGSYKTLDARALAFKMNEEWVNAIAIFFPTMKDEKSVISKQKKDLKKLEEFGISKIKKIKVLQEVSKAGIIPNLFNQMAKGNLTLGNFLVKLRDGYDSVSYQDYERYVIKPVDYLDFLTFAYFIHSKKAVASSFHKINVDDDFLSLGLTADELGVEWLNVKDFTNVSFNAILVLPVYIRLLDSKYLGDGKLNLRLKAHKTLLDNFNLLFNLQRYNTRYEKYESLDTFSGRLNSFPYEEEGDFAYIDIHHDFRTVPNEEDRVVLRVFNETLGVVIETVERIRDIFSYKAFKNDYLQASSLFVNLEELEEYLVRPVSKAGQSKASDAFERAAAWLLSLLGFNVMEMGDLGLGVVREDKYEVGEADLITQDASTSKIYVVSCSLKPPSDAKVDKIANLAEHIRRKGLMVEPLMAVSEGAGEVKRNTRRVKVLDRDDLIKVISLLRSENFGEAKRIVTEPSF